MLAVTVLVARGTECIRDCYERKTEQLFVDGLDPKTTIRLNGPKRARTIEEKHMSPGSG